MKNKEITLQTILDVMNSKFEKVEKRLDGIDNRIAGIEKRLDNVEYRLSCVEKRLDNVENRLNCVENRLSCVEKRLDNVENRLSCVENRLDNVENRLDNMDIRITKLAADNKEAHEKIFEELQKQGNTLTRIETEYGDKLAILFDANEYTRDRLHLFGNQQLRFSKQLENFSHRLTTLEKAVFVKN